jgi:hypothetical protein
MPPNAHGRSVPKHCDLRKRLLDQTHDAIQIGNQGLPASILANMPDVLLARLRRGVLGTLQPMSEGLAA